MRKLALTLAIVLLAGCAEASPGGPPIQPVDQTVSVAWADRGGSVEVPVGTDLKIDLGNAPGTSWQLGTYPRSNLKLLVSDPAQHSFSLEATSPGEGYVWIYPPVASCGEPRPTAPTYGCPVAPGKELIDPLDRVHGMPLAPDAFAIHVTVVSSS